MNQIPDLPNLLDKELAVSYNLHMSQKNHKRWFVVQPDIYN